jgi:hypothetical protein
MSIYTMPTQVEQSEQHPARRDGRARRAAQSNGIYAAAIEAEKELIESPRRTRKQ